MPLKVGITGGIGTGKSTVSKIFEILGIPVYYADAAAKLIMNDDEDLKNKIIQSFGEAAYTNGKLNRNFLAQKVFSDKEKLELLNSWIHPATIAAADAWMKKQVTPYALKEAALIFESHAEKKLDYVIGISAPENLRIERVQKRDGISKEEILKRIQKQMPENEKMLRCHFIIYNDEKQLLVPQVLKIHETLLSLASKQHNSSS